MLRTENGTGRQEAGVFGRTASGMGSESQFRCGCGIGAARGAGWVDTGRRRRRMRNSRIGLRSREGRCPGRLEFRPGVERYIRLRFGLSREMVVADLIGMAAEVRIGSKRIRSCRQNRGREVRIGFRRRKKAVQIRCGAVAVGVLNRNVALIKQCSGQSMHGFGPRSASAVSLSLPGALRRSGYGPMRNCRIGIGDLLCIGDRELSCRRIPLPGGADAGVRGVGEAPFRTGIERKCECRSRLCRCRVGIGIPDA